MGPTAAGKTALALELHERFGFELVSVDSSQVYRGMDVGTAKPTPAELARAPHRLIDIRDPAEAYSAATFRADALAAMAEITRAGRVPLLVGGTMFYFRALEYGLSALPAADTAVRARLTAEANEVGWPALHRRLAALDPAGAARIDPNDPQRIQRALELHALTGAVPSVLKRRAPAQPFPYRATKIALGVGARAVLHARIAQRFRGMLERGLVGEVEALYARGDLSPEMPSVRTVGYRQVWEYLTKTINYSEMEAKAIAATRQLAKRQLTWLRNDKGVVWVQADRPGYERVVCRMISSIFPEAGRYND